MGRWSDEILWFGFLVGVALVRYGSAESELMLMRDRDNDSCNLCLVKFGRYGYHSMDVDGRDSLIPPDPNGLVFTSTPNLLSIGAPVHRKHFIFMTRQVHGEFAGSDIPHFQRGVLGRGDQKARVGRETTLIDGADVAAECGDEPGPVRNDQNLTREW